MKALSFMSHTSAIALRHPFAAQHLQSIERNTTRSFFYALIVLSSFVFCTAYLLQQREFVGLYIPDRIEVIGTKIKPNKEDEPKQSSPQNGKQKTSAQQTSSTQHQTMTDGSYKASSTHSVLVVDTMQKSSSSSTTLNSDSIGNGIDNEAGISSKNGSYNGTNDGAFGTSRSETNDDEFDPSIEVYPDVDLTSLQQLVEYPEVARQLRIEGTVTLNVLVGVDGRAISSVVVSSPHQLLSSAAEKAVMNVTFSPARQNNKNVPCRITIPVKFSLR